MYRTSKHENNCFFPRSISRGDYATRLMSHTKTVAKSARVQKLRNCTEAKRLIEKQKLNKKNKSAKKKEKGKAFMDEQLGHGGKKNVQKTR